MDIKEIRVEYKEVMGKIPFHGWTGEQMIEKMEEFKNAPVVEEVVEAPVVVEPTPVEPTIDLEEQARMIEAHKINTMQHKLVPEDTTPIYLEGEPYCIINNKYVPYAEAAVIIQERKIQQEQDVLAELKEEL